MPEQLRVLVALTEDHRSVPSTHMVAHKPIVAQVLRNSLMPSFGPPRAPDTQVVHT